LWWVSYSRRIRRRWAWFQTRVQGARRHDPVQAKAPGQHPRQGGDHGAVGPVRLRAGDLTAQDRNLVPQDQDLRVLRGVASREERQPAEQPDHENVDEANEHECRGYRPRSDALREFWHRTRPGRASAAGVRPAAADVRCTPEGGRRREVTGAPWARQASPGRAER
jgi:hypothetical protein